MDVRVLVASEVRLYQEGLQRVLQGIAGIVLVGIASSVEELLAQAAALVPTVILLDMAMARSLSVAKHLSRRPLEGGVVVLGIPEGGGGLLSTLPVNLLGYVTRDGTVADLLAAIRCAGRGERYCSRSLAPLLGVRPHGAQAPPAPSASFGHLTTREMEILELVREGFSNKAISRQLGIGLSTVKNHVHSVLAKLGVHCRSEAIAVLNRHESGKRGNGAAPRAGLLVEEKPIAAV